MREACTYNIMQHASQVPLLVSCFQNVLPIYGSENDDLHKCPC